MLGEFIASVGRRLLVRSSLRHTLGLRNSLWTSPTTTFTLHIKLTYSAAAFMSSTYTPLIRFDKPRFGRPNAGALSQLISSLE